MEEKGDSFFNEFKTISLIKSYIYYIIKVSDIQKVRKGVFIMITQLRGRSQITIPKNIIETLGLKEGDNLNIEIENGKIIVKPVVMVPKNQAWFWTDEWQLAEKEVDEDIKAGKIKTASNIDDLMKDLRDED